LGSTDFCSLSGAFADRNGADSVWLMSASAEVGPQEPAMRPLGGNPVAFSWLRTIVRFSSGSLNQNSCLVADFTQHVPARRVPRFVRLTTVGSTSWAMLQCTQDLSAVAGSMKLLQKLPEVMPTSGGSLLQRGRIASMILAEHPVGDQRHRQPRIVGSTASHQQITPDSIY